MDGKFIGLHRDAAAIKPVSVMGHESNLKARKKGPSMRRGVDLDLTSVGGMGGHYQVAVWLDFQNREDLQRF